MKTRIYTSFNTRANAQVNIPVLRLLGCLYRVPDYLSGRIAGYMPFSHPCVHNRRYALFTGSSSRV